MTEPIHLIFANERAEALRLAHDLRVRLITCSTWLSWGVSLVATSENLGLDSLLLAELCDFFINLLKLQGSRVLL